MVVIKVNDKTARAVQLGRHGFQSGRSTGKAQSLQKKIIMDALSRIIIQDLKRTYIEIFFFNANILINSRKYKGNYKHVTRTN